MRTRIKMRAWEKPGTVYLVWCPDAGETPDDARQVEADDAGSAAEDWAEYDDQSSVDYAIVSGSGITVHVRPRDEQETAAQVFTVTGEMVAQYHAKEAGT